MSNSTFAIYPSLKDRVVVISGGATGIGASLTTAFAHQGAQVVILDIQPDAATQLISTLSAQNVAHAPIYENCDLTRITKEINPVAATILARFPLVHGLINNAARDTRQQTLSISPEDWDASIAVNLRHVFFLTQALMPALLAARASVVNMGSITWDVPSVGVLPYAASKSAIVGLTKTLAHEFGDRGVRVNSIMPGAVETERQRRDVLTPEYREWVLSRQAMKRLLRPEEIARAALWLVADDSSGMTSQSMVVDAGWV